MARRFTTKGIRWPAKKKPIWVNLPFGGVNYSETVGRQLLMLPEDWEASFTGLANERATLKAVVGEVIFSQTAAGTLGGNLFWGIYMHGPDQAVPVFTTTGMSDVSWLVVGARSTASSVSSSITTTTMIGSQPIRIKAKRRLLSTSQFSICAQYGADAASPAGVMSGILRFLVTRD